MDCENFNSWRPTPAGSTVAISVAGDQDVFTARVRVNCLGQQPDEWAHSEVAPGPRTRVIDAGDSCAFTIIIVVVAAPEEPIVATATLTNPDGQQVRACTWQFSTAGSFAVVVDVLTN